MKCNQLEVVIRLRKYIFLKPHSKKKVKRTLWMTRAILISIAKKINHTGNILKQTLILHTFQNSSIIGTIKRLN